MLSGKRISVVLGSTKYFNIVQAWLITSIMKNKLLFSVLLTLTLMTAGHAQTLDKAKVDQLFDRLLEKNKGMGSLLIARDGNVLYSRSFGYSQINGNEKRPLNAETKYQISSISKTYTAVMIFQLVEEGKLKLTDTLDKFFPQIPNAPRITVAHILAHRSGIHSPEADGSWGLQPRTKEEVIARIAQGQPDFEPGSRTQYSNAGYNLLGYVVEKAGGKPYAEALKDRITSKLGLNDTYLGVSKSDAGRNEALAYRYIGGWAESAQLDFSVTGGAGAILSTPSDMAKFIQALFDLKLVSADSLKLMTTTRDGEAMGMTTFTFAGKTFFGETGGSGSTGAWLNYLPEEKLAVAYTTNAKVYPVKDIVSGALDVYWNRPFEVPNLEGLALSTDILDRYVGVYSIPGTPARVTFTRDGQTLFFQPASENAGVPIEATAENKFKIDPFVLFEFDVANGRLTINRAGQERTFTKEK
jgi:D-alanyl-D-alanine carboxypeptidase